MEIIIDLTAFYIQIIEDIYLFIKPYLLVFSILFGISLLVSKLLTRLFGISRVNKEITSLLFVSLAFITFTNLPW